MRREIWKRRLAVLMALVLVWNVFSDQFISVRASKTDGAADLQNQIMAEGSIEGNQEGFEVYAFDVNLVEGDTKTPITDESDIYAGAEVEVTFEWSLDDTVRVPEGEEWTPQEFTIDTNSDAFKCSGLNIPGMEVGTETAPLPLYATGQAKVVGSYYMKDGIIHIIIDDEEFFQHEENRYGGVSFKGTVERSDDNTEDGKPKKIEFGSHSATPDYYLSKDESSAEVRKSTVGSLVSEGGKYYQTFTVDITAKNGTVTEIDLQDSVYPAGKLTNPQNVMITASDVDGLPLGTYDSLDDALAAIRNATFYKDEKITLQYTMEVDASIYEQNAEWHKNVISGTYKSNRDEEPKNVSTEAWINVNKPSIYKSGISYAQRDGKGYVTWTITINLGDYYTGSSTDLADYLNSITDIPGSGQVATEEFTLDPSKFVQDANNPAVFTYTYETEVTEEIVSSTSDETVKNKVKMTTADGNAYESNEAGYTIPGAGPYIKKTIHEKVRDEDGLHVTWDIVISGIPKSGITELTLNDDARHWNNNPGSQTLLCELYIDGVLVMDSNGILDTTKIKSAENWSSGQYGKVVFQDDYVNEVAAAEGSINLQVKTLITEDTIGKEYGNGASVSYKDKTTGSQTTMPESRATFQDTTNILFKEGKVVMGKDAIDYTIRVILPALNIQAPGETFRIEDVLPAGLKLSDEGYDVALYDQWGNRYATVEHTLTQTPVAVAGSTENATKLTFNIVAEEEWLNQVKGYPGSTREGYYLTVKYRGEVTDRGQFIAEGEKKSFTNSASATYAGESIGKDSVTNTLTPTQIVNKSAEYTVNSAPHIKYTVNVNTEAVTLLDGVAKLQAVDTIGYALKFVDEGAHQVQAIDVATGNELVKGTDYTYSFSANMRTINFELPDSKYIKLIYWGYAEPGTHLTPENSTNSFSLSGMSSDATKGKHSFDMVAYKPSGWAGSEVGSIVLYKFWTDNNEQFALEGSVFRLDAVSYDEATNTFITERVIQDNLKITDSNREGEAGSGKMIITDLPVNQIMALYEIDADDGFALNKKPYYFILEGSTAVDYPENVGIDKFVSGSELPYENEKAGGLKLRKSFTDSLDQLTWDEIKDSISFKIYDEDGEEIPDSPVSASTFIQNGIAYESEVLELPAGTYKVEEVLTTPSGYEVTTSYSYVVEGEQAQYGSGATTPNMSVEEAKETAVTFLNSYSYTGTFPVPVSKVALTGRQAISGATLTISGQMLNGTAIEPITWTTDAASAKEIQLYPGSYVLQEVTVPTGYLKAADIAFTVSVDGTIIVDNQPVTQVTMEDEEISVKLTKVELDDNTTELDGAVVAVYKAEDIGNDGRPKAGATALDVWTSVAGTPHDFGSVLEAGGHYVFVELSAPTGYELADNIEFMVNMDGAVEVITAGVTVRADGVILMEDAVKAGEFCSIVLTKTITGDMEPVELEGKLQFKVESMDVSPAFSETYTLGKDAFLQDGVTGKYVLSITNLTPGTYKVTEILGSSTPDNRTCTVSYTISAGAANGSGTQTGEFVVAKDAEVTVAYTNDYDYIIGELQVAKTFAQVNKDISWATIAPSLTFRIYDEEGQEVNGSPISGSSLVKNGDVYESSVLELPVGTYTVEEVCTAVEDYKVTTTYSVVVNGAASGSGNTAEADGVAVQEGRTTVVTYANTYTYTGTYPVSVSKVELGGTEEIAGAVLAITGTRADGEAFETITWTTVAGQSKEVDLYPGSYTLTETKAPTGYALAAAVAFTVETDGTIKVNGQTADKVLMEDEPISFRISKLEATGTQSVVGAEFAVYKASDMNGDVPKDGAVAVDSWTSTNGGIHDCGEKLEAGESYVLVETKAPKGYGYIDPVAFKVETDGTITTNLEKDNYNSYLVRDNKISAKLSKVDLADNSIVLAGAVIELYSADDIDTDGTPKSGAQPLDSWTSVVGEPHDFGDVLEAGKSYVLVEQTAPDGYELAANITFTVNKDGSITVDNADVDSDGVILMEDEATVPEPGTLVLTKSVTGVMDAKELEGKLQFKVESADSATHVFNKTYTLGEDEFLWNETEGKYILTITDLPIGSYKVTEILGDTTPDNMSHTVSYTVDTTPAASGDTTQTGAIGLGSRKTVTVDYVNDYQYITGALKVSKSFADADGNLTWAEIAPTLSFSIYDEDGQEVTGSPIAGTDLQLVGGVYESEELELPIGTYTVKETCTALTDYQVSTTYTITVGTTAGGSGNSTQTGDVAVEEGTTTTVAFANTYTYTGVVPVTFSVTKTDLTGTASVVGAVLEIYLASDVTDGVPNAGAMAVDSWTSTNSSYKDFGPALTAGESYVLIESYAPKGYAYIDPIRFTVEDDGSVTVNLTAGNGVYQVKDTPFSVKLSKVDAADTGVAVEGAEIAVYDAADVNTDGSVQDGATAIASWTSTAEAYDFGSFLEAGKSYVFVEESAPAGYEVTTNIAFTIAKDGTVTITSSGTEEMVDGVIMMKDAVSVVAPELGSLKLTKTVAGVLDRTELEGKLTFNVENADDTTPAYNETFTLGEDDFLWDAGLSKYVLVIENLPVGNYKVTEVVGNTTPDNMSCTTTYIIGAGTDTTGTQIGAVEVAKDTETTVAFTNTYAYRMGALKVSKSFTEATDTLTWDDIKNNITFKIYDETGSEISESPISGADLKTSGSVHVSDPISLPIGSYKVEEVLTTITGYTVTTTYSIDVDGTADGSGSTVATGDIELGEGETITVTYTNTYEKEAVAPSLGSLKLTKTIAGVLDRTALGGKLKFTVENADATTPTYNETFTLGEDDFQWDADLGKYVLVIENLPVGNYKVTEVLGDTTPGNMSCTTTYIIGAGTDTTGTQTGAVEVAKDTETEVAFTNTYAYRMGALRVSKSFTEATGTLTWDDIKNNITFKIYDETGSEISESPISGADLKASGSVYESDPISLPIGSYKVEEVLTTITGYTVTTTYSIDVDGTADGSGSTVATGDIELGEGETITVAYTNTYVKDVVAPKTGKLIITKTLKGKFDRAAAVNAITFTVTNNDTQEVKTYKLSEFTYDEATGLYTLELEYTVGGYTVEETVTTVDGYKLSKVTYTVNGSTTEGKKAVVDVPEDSSVTVAYEDTYKKVTKPSNDDDDDDDPEPEPEPIVPPVPQPTSLTKTGDETPLALWMAMFACGLLGLATGCFALIRRRREN